MESVESPLEVLSRAATMMQHRHAYPASDSDSFESPSTASGGESEGDRERERVSPEAAPPARSKELPSAKWRRERRSTRLPDYKPRENGSKALRSQSFTERRGGAWRGERARVAAHSDGESPDEADGTLRPAASGAAASGAATNGAVAADARGAPPEYPSEAPIDMRLKSRPTPPPYPLGARPAAAAPAAPAAPRASVITRSQDAPGTGSMSMCDPVIDEHFRRSLGDDYMTLFARRPEPRRSTRDRGSSPIAFPGDPAASFLRARKPEDEPEKPEKPEKPEETEKKPEPKKLEKVICEDAAMEIDSASSSVDDHFAKALGDTWRKIQISRLEAEKPGEEGKLRRGVVI